MDIKSKQNELMQALIKAQKEVVAPKKGAINPHFKSKYATLDMVYESCRKPLLDNNLNLSHTVEFKEGKYWLVTHLYHANGECMTTHLPMFIDKVTSQGFGSALTYARRYAICSLLALPCNEDDDGNAADKDQSKASVSPYVNEKQLEDLLNILNGHDDIKARVLCFYKITSFEALLKDHFAQCKTNIQKAIKQKVKNESN